MSKMKNVVIEEQTRKRDYAEMGIHLSVCEGREVLSRSEVLDIVHQALVTYEQRQKFMENPMFKEE